MNNLQIDIFHLRPGHGYIYLVFDIESKQNIMVLFWVQYAVDGEALRRFLRRTTAVGRTFLCISKKNMFE